LQAKGIELDRRKIALSEPIRAVGEHTVEVKLHRELGVEVKVIVRGADTPVEPEETEESDEADSDEAALEALDSEQE